MRGIAEALAKGVTQVTREHYKEKKRLERSSRASYRGWSRPRCPIKYEVFDAMPEAIERVSGGGSLPFTVRQLFYQIRPLLEGKIDRALEYAYFTPALVTEYEKSHGTIRGLLYDSRGTFREPHTGVGVPLGTTHVASYSIPHWRYNKIVYVEKEGFGPIFEAAKLSERYDLGLMMGKGYATRAAKDLLRLAKGRGVTILALHDCDVDGYEIKRTLAEATRTRPGHYIEVIDIGLMVADVEALGLATERVARRKAPPWLLRLTSKEKDFLVERRLRCELNAMTSHQLITYIETKLAEHGLTSKVVPPEEVVEAEFLENFAAHLREAAKEMANAAFKKVTGGTFDSFAMNAFYSVWEGVKLPKGFRAMLERELHDGSRGRPWDGLVADKAETQAKERARKKRAMLVRELIARLKSIEGGI